MNKTNNNPSSLTLRPKELEAVYAISQAVARALDTESALDEIINLVRPIFIFDNIALYEPRQDPTLEPTYVRAIGRGRFREADLTWGGPIAERAFSTKKTTTRIEEVEGSDKDRTNIRHMLALPLVQSEQALGALVFIRFGGPDYSEEQTSLAEFISVHVAQLLGRRHLVDRIANLEAKRRLDSLQDEFIAMITHELLTPLGFIKGYATTLLRDDISWEEETRNEFLIIIDEEADRLRELIGNILDSSRLKTGTLQMTFQTTRLDTLLRDVSLRTKSLYENLEIDIDIKSPGVQVRADPERLAQVFENITINAIKYAPESPIQITLENSDDHALISFRDQGPGISEEHLDKIFQRFYRVPDQPTSARGSGLGLYICHMIISAHGGEIQAQSTLGEGTVFNIIIPHE